MMHLQGYKFVAKGPMHKWWDVSKEIFKNLETSTRNNKCTGCKKTGTTRPNNTPNSFQRKIKWGKFETRKHFNMAETETKTYHTALSHISGLRLHLCRNKIQMDPTCTEGSLLQCQEAPPHTGSRQPLFSKGPPKIFTSFYPQETSLSVFYRSCKLSKDASIKKQVCLNSTGPANFL